MKNKLKWPLKREKTALLVIDMQNDFVLENAIMEVKEAKKQVPKIKSLIAKCRELEIPVIYTIHETDPTLCALEIVAFPHLKNAGMRKGTKGVEVIDDLKPNPDEKVVRKHRFSAFYQTDLELFIRNIKANSAIDTLIICGTVTHICCESTARDAFYRDFKVVFGTDICSVDCPDIQAATIKNMEIFGSNLDCATILKALENGIG
ncbi:MAG: cysteine hydrolase [Defluviitaleaceae bacterium]|nr:cysteine hydrolase [Defluviitaleaceae bacterium]